MSYIDSPLGICEDEHTVVLLDQTQPQCALEHGCPEGRKCPLGTCFVEDEAKKNTESDNLIR